MENGAVDLRRVFCYRHMNKVIENNFQVYVDSHLLKIIYVNSGNLSCKLFEFFQIKYKSNKIDNIDPHQIDKVVVEYQLCSIAN